MRCALPADADTRLLNTNCWCSAFQAAARRAAEETGTALKTRQAQFRKALEDNDAALEGISQRIEKLGDEATDEQRARQAALTELKEAHQARLDAINGGVQLFADLFAVAGLSAAGMGAGAAEGAAEGDAEAPPPPQPVTVDVAPADGGSAVVGLGKASAAQQYASEVLEAKAVYVLHKIPVSPPAGGSADPVPLVFDIPPLPEPAPAAGAS